MRAVGGREGVWSGVSCASTGRKILGMTSVKEEARRLVEKLPDNATWDDVMYEIYVRQKIQAGLAAVERGNVVSHEDVKKRFASRR